MTIKTAPVILAVVLSLAACGPMVPIHSSNSAAMQMPTVSSGQATKMTSLGLVTGHSCKSLLWDPAATPEAATAQVKNAAANLGAKAISDLQCERGGFSLGKNCWDSYVCRADALK